ncbi:hypothetical protein FA15DRAFT_459035 [Coprinopsis marcescibilis]|uniref:BTB domain-containing protein n=1 Tax=Coprinopsis marcescibilis TaxID=230819 RepID=A0A5C3KSL5_COPMA|nr:hypothetical protein FA15DRAFT_459035 [Coprinopsis marcescibilis]
MSIATELVPAAPGKYIGHDVYFWEFVTFKVEDRLFQLPKYRFMQSETFVQEHGLCIEYGHENVQDSRAIQLDVGLAEFEHFLKALYPMTPFYSGNQELSTEEWISVLRVSSKWLFVHMRIIAIEHLTAVDMDPIDRACLAKELHIRSWLASSYEKLLMRPEMFTKEEAARIGWEVAIRMVGIIIERLRTPIKRDVAGSPRVVVERWFRTELESIEETAQRYLPQNDRDTTWQVASAREVLERAELREEIVEENEDLEQGEGSVESGAGSIVRIADKGNPELVEGIEDSEHRDEVPTERATESFKLAKKEETVQEKGEIEEGRQMESEGEIGSIQTVKVAQDPGPTGPSVLPNTTEIKTEAEILVAKAHTAGNSPSPVPEPVITLAAAPEALSSIQGSGVASRASTMAAEDGVAASRASAMAREKARPFKAQSSVGPPAIALAAALEAQSSIHWQENGVASRTSTIAAEDAVAASRASAMTGEEPRPFKAQSAVGPSTQLSTEGSKRRVAQDHHSWGRRPLQVDMQTQAKVERERGKLWATVGNLEAEQARQRLKLARIAMELPVHEEASVTGLLGRLVSSILPSVPVLSNGKTGMPIREVKPGLPAQHVRAAQITHVTEKSTSLPYELFPGGPSDWEKS